MFIVFDWGFSIGSRPALGRHRRIGAGPSRAVAAEDSPAARGASGGLRCAGRRRCAGARRLRSRTDDHLTRRRSAFRPARAPRVSHRLRDPAGEPAPPAPASHATPPASAAPSTPAATAMPSVRDARGTTADTLGRSLSSAQQIYVVLNWTEELKRLVPAK
jgi:hypothetical protein